MTDPLDNAVWHALTGPQHDVAQRNASAARYEPDVAPFAALPDEPSAAAWDDLRALVGPGNGAVLFRAEVDAPDGWEVLWRGIGFQMVATTPPPGAARDGAGVTPLGHADVDDMTDLVACTRPGPFLPRTITLGTYLGVRLDGKLVAMAGERMRLDGFTEVSAVCVHDAYRGRGYAARLVGELVARVCARRETAFLHVVGDNAPAIALYEKLGFVVRRTIEAAGVRAPG